MADAGSARPGLDEPKEAASVLPYLRRVEELQEVLPSVAFYVLRFAIDKLSALRNKEIPNNPAKSTAFAQYLSNHLDKAEALKLQLEPAAKENGKAYMKDFCLGVFRKAEQERCKPKAEISKELVFQYYVAGIFVDTMSQFGPLDSDLASIRSFSRTLTVELKKLYDVGETHIPEEAIQKWEAVCGLSQVGTTNNSGATHTPSTDAPHQSLYSDNMHASESPRTRDSLMGRRDATNAPLPATGLVGHESQSRGDFGSTDLVSADVSSRHTSPPSNCPQPSTSTARGATTVTGATAAGRQIIKKATSEVKYALSALAFDDVAGAIQNLQTALALLQTGDGNGGNS